MNMEVKKRHETEGKPVNKEARVDSVKRIAQSLMERSNWKEVESSFNPEYFKEYISVDADGNELSVIRDLDGVSPMPLYIKDKNGRLIAQSWDGQSWSVDKDNERGEDFRIENDYEAVPLLRSLDNFKL